MTKEQAEIIRWARSVGGQFTKTEAVKKFPYYGNTENLIGQRLSRMVNAGLLTRVKAGVYKVGGAKKIKLADANQSELF